MDSHTHFMEQPFNKPYSSMECKCTTKEIERIIKSLKAKNSYGYDEISTKILKINGPFISSPINYICNKMLFWGVFPDRLKQFFLPCWRQLLLTWRVVSMWVSLWGKQLSTSSAMKPCSYLPWYALSSFIFIAKLYCDLQLLIFSVIQVHHTV